MRGGARDGRDVVGTVVVVVVVVGRGRARVRLTTPHRDASNVMATHARSSDLDTARARTERDDASNDARARRQDSCSVARRARARDDDSRWADDDDSNARATRRRRDDGRDRRDDDDGNDRRDDGRARAPARGARADEGRAFGVGGESPRDAPKIPKEEANFALSGLLDAEANSVRGVALKYCEPLGEAKPPSVAWRLYCFKGDVECEPPYKLSGSKTSYLVGRDRAVVDIPSDHPSCSKQHCVIQFRDVDDGRGSEPYAYDLGSANGTRVNKRPIEAKAYVRLKSKDVIKFAHSSRDYVLLREDVAAS